MDARRLAEAVEELETVEASTGLVIDDPLSPSGARPHVGSTRRSSMPSPWSWHDAEPWECPRCLTVIMTNVAAPRCPRCRFVEGT